MFRLFSAIIIIVCYSNFVFASSRHKKNQCGANEILSACANNACDYRTCSGVVQPIECLMFGRKHCKKGCICADNYLRADNGTCIPASQCPNARRKCPKPNEYYDLCPPQCPSRTCAVMDNVTCPEPLQAGDPRCPPPSCRCNVGFYRDTDGNCVTWNLCKAECGDNEVFDVCPSSCPDEQCGVDPSTTLCLPRPQPGDPSCQPRCRCRDGYMRDKHGKCIPQSQCPKCPANETQTQCFEAKCERRDCSDISKPVVCISINTDYCTVGCLCKDGFLRAQNGMCIPINQCPEDQCGDNEVFDVCPSSCPDEQCGVDPSTTLCLPSPQPGDPSCQPRCRCRDGYMRDKHGKCIPQSQCPKCPANETQTQCFEAKCERRDCSDIPKPVVCASIITDHCTVGCLCKDRYLRAQNGTCIPINQCPEAQCGDNEVFDVCPSSCPDEQCGVDPSTTLCLPSPQPGDLSCQPRCRCRDGYLRNKHGKCIPQSQCPKCPANETQTQCFEAKCERRDCSDISKPVVCTSINTDYCTVGCLCKNGFLRAQNGMCIPINQCPEAQCGVNEVFDVCPSSCPDEQCGVDPSTTLCLPSPQPGDPSCQPRCRCRDGYLRNKHGKCISQSQCPNCPANETQTQCFDAKCERRDCSDISKPVVCTSINTDYCTVGCLCKDGFLRAQNGMCIPINQCPEAQCGDNEVFDVCPSSCPDEQCGVDPSTTLCLPSLQPGDPSCQPRCRCRDGYLRNKHGKCISQSQCPKCPANETKTQCFEAKCERRDCSDISKPVVCTSINTDYCTVGCLCKDGFLRAQNGMCIPINQCPEAQCGDNEVFDVCPSSCPDEQCGVDPSTTLCLPGPQPGDSSCQPRCRCRDGYLRNKHGKCISQSQCPKCPANETQTQCFDAKCERRDCSDISKPLVCTSINTDYCTVGCLCKDGFLRAKNGMCIPINQCPEAQCGDNEVFDVCPSTCPDEHCGVDPSTTLCLPSPQPGDPSCQPRCRCRDGYLRNKHGKCIPQSQCPKCPANETQTQCFEAKCERRDCSDISKPVVCTSINTDYCTVGCLCKDGFLRAQNGMCIPIKQCPEAQCGDNEVFDVCPSSCPDEQCGVDPSTTLCLPSPQSGDPSCQPRCRCRKGYLRNNYGKCISRSQCPKCPANEKQTQCFEAKCERRYCSDIPKPVVCTSINTNYCTIGCLCKDGFLRAQNGTCIPINQCPEAQCGVNEVFDVCPSSCPDEQCGVDPSTTLCLPSPLPGNPSCQPRCRCRDGYLRNKHGKCIPQSQCPKCPANEKQTQCFLAKCEHRDCSDIPKPVVCTSINTSYCTIGCLCKDGFLRAQNGTCIPINQCPEALCGGDNEVFDICPSSCPDEQCGVYPSTTLCLPGPQPGDSSCQPRCRCRDGYLRNKHGKCIPQSQCHKCQENEIQTQCFEGRCERRDCSDIPKPVDCVRIYPDFCTVGCLCKYGFLRAKNGTCIPINQCPEAQCADNEVFDVCPPTCAGEQCGVYPSTTLCLPSPQPGDPSCQPRCRCRDGYLRNNKGKCIPQSQCQKTPPTQHPDFATDSTSIYILE